MVAFHSYSIFDLVGVAGFLLYLTAYTSLTLRWVSAPSVPYFMLNLGAASCVLFSLTQHFNLASAMIQVFWVCISLVGLALHWRRVRKTAPGFRHTAHHSPSTLILRDEQRILPDYHKDAA